MLMPARPADVASRRVDCERERGREGEREGGREGVGNECLVFDARHPAPASRLSSLVSRLFVRFLFQNERALKGRHGGLL